MDNNNQENDNKDKEFGDKLLDHNYDGIKELDNSLPPWWMILFYITINFALFYAVFFFGVGLFQQEDELKAEYEEAEIALTQYREEQQALLKSSPNASSTPEVVIDENNVKLDKSETALAEGKSIFTANCAACHRTDGGGGIGPNLTDAYWIHGGEFRDVFKITKYGVPAKGMIAWQTQLNPEQLRDVTSYIYALLKDTNVSDGKAPEGEKVAN